MYRDRRSAARGVQGQGLSITLLPPGLHPLFCRREDSQDTGATAQAPGQEDSHTFDLPWCCGSCCGPPILENTYESSIFSPAPPQSHPLDIFNIRRWSKLPIGTESGTKYPCPPLSSPHPPCYPAVPPSLPACPSTASSLSARTRRVTRAKRVARARGLARARRVVRGQGGGQG